MLKSRELQYEESQEPARGNFTDQEGIQETKALVPSNPGQTHSGDLLSEKKQKSTQNKRIKLNVEKRPKNKMEYDPLKCPPDLEISLRHAVSYLYGFYTNLLIKKSRQIGENLLVKQGKLTLKDICPCCGYVVENKPYPLNIHRYKLSDLGPGIPLFLEYSIYSLSMLLFLFLIFGLFATYSNLKAGKCIELSEEESQAFVDAQKRVCEYTNLNIITMANKVDDDWEIIVQSWAVFIICIIMDISIKVFRFYQHKTAKLCDEKVVSASDFTLMLTGLPKGEYSEAEILTFLQNLWGKATENLKSSNKGSFNIKKIVMAYDIREFIRALNKKNSLEMIKKKLLKNSQIANRENLTADKQLVLTHKKSLYQLYLNSIDKKLETIKKKITIMENDIINKDTKYLCGTVFVSISDEKTLSNFLVTEIFKRSLFSFIKCVPTHLKFKKEKIQLRKAPEPCDILWENLGHPLFYRIRNRIITNFLTSILLLSSFGTIMSWWFLEKYVFERFIDKDNMSDLQVETLFKVSRVINATMIFIFNEILNILINKLVIYEKHKTITSYTASVAAKIFKAQFLNTTIIIFLAQVINKRYQIFLNNYLVTDIVIIFVTNMIVPPLLTIFDPVYLYKLYMRRKIRKSINYSYFTQTDANYWFEGPTLNISQKYSQVIMTMWFTFFYAPLVPLGIFISFLGLLLNYFADKYTLLRRHSRPVSMGPYLNQIMLRYLEFCPLCMAAGNSIFSLLLAGSNGDSNVGLAFPNFLSLIITTASLILPWSSFKMKCLNKKEIMVDGDFALMLGNTYDEASRRFLTDYDRTNPVTKEKAVSEWINKFKSNCFSLKFMRTFFLSQAENKDTLTGAKFHNARAFIKMMKAINGDTKEILNGYANIDFKLKLAANSNDFRSHMMMKALSDIDDIVKKVLIMKKSIYKLKTPLNKRKSRPEESENNESRFNHEDVSGILDSSNLGKVYEYSSPPGKFHDSSGPSGRSSFNNNTFLAFGTLKNHITFEEKHSENEIEGDLKSDTFRKCEESILEINQAAKLPRLKEDLENKISVINK